MVHDREEQVRLLNQDIMGEHQAIVHYLTHAWTVVVRFGPAIEAIARDEMRHFKWLAHTIVALGGVPDLTPPDGLPQFNGLAALDYDIDAEEEAISQYQNHQQRIADERVQALIGRIVVDERHHRQQFIGFRDQWQKQPDDRTWERGGEPSLNPELGQRLQLLVSKEYREILRQLMNSFLAVHLRQVGLTAEDRAIDDMQHLGLVAETLARQGGYPSFTVDADSPVDELTLYQDLRTWAASEAPPLVPLVTRIMRHEEYQERTAGDGGWTVGSTTRGG